MGKIWIMTSSAKNSLKKDNKKRLERIFYKKFLILVFIFGMCLIILSTNSFSQKTFDISKKPIRDTIISEFKDIPIVYKLELNSKLEREDYYHFFTLLNAIILPNSPVLVSPNKTKIIDLKIYVKDRKPGGYSYSYYIKNSEELYEDAFSFRIMSAKDAFSVELPEEISPKEKTLKIKIKNNVNEKFENLSLRIESEFINEKKIFSLDPKKEKELLFKISKDLRNVDAGDKLIRLKISSNEDNYYSFNKTIKVAQYENITSEKNERFFILGKRIVLRKINNGNHNKKVEINFEVGPFEKFFFTSNVKPNEIKKEKGRYIYTFQKELKPKEKFEIIITFNYLWIALLLIMVLAFLIVIYIKKSQEVVVFRKEAKKVKTKSEKTAIKVTLKITNKSKDPIKDVVILDYIPLSLKYYEYGRVVPDKIKGNRLYWKFLEILPKEKKQVSYLCYSKIEYEGRIKLPKAKVKILLKDKKYIIASNSPKIEM